MKISSKVFLFLFSISILSFFLIFFVLKIDNARALTFENKQIIQHIKTFYNSLALKKDFLETLSYEYSTNDSLVYFLNHKKWDKKLLLSKKISHFLLFDKNKNFLYEEVYDINSNEYISSSNEIKSFIKYNDIDKLLQNKSSITFMTLDYEKVLFSIKKVKDKNKTIGYIFLARTLDSTFLSNLSLLSHNYVSLISSNKAKNLEKLNLGKDSIFFSKKILDDKTIFVYVDFFDYMSEENFSIRMKINRDYFFENKQSNFLLLIFFSLVLVLFIIIVYIFTNRVFIKRINDISSLVKQVSKSKSLNLKIPLLYDDEITYLSKKINKMFEILKNKEYEKIKKERDFLQSILDLQESIILITDGEKIENTNKKFENIFQSKEHFLSNIALLDDKTHANLLNVASKYKSEDNPAKLKVYDDHKYFTFDIQEIDMQKYLICMNDVSKINEKICDLRKMASMDQLTNIYNKSTMTSIIGYWLKLRVFSMILFDIDYFKKINDTYGHHIGDCILKDLIKEVKTVIHKEDLLGRVGGEEFILIFDNNQKEAVLSIAQRIRKKIESTIFTYENININITISLGCTICNKDESYELVFKRVDKALYNSKKAGRNTCSYI